jgi:glutathione synthase/RimK-type ligase-like ATP-grasp enzyme
VAAFSAATFFRLRLFHGGYVLLVVTATPDATADLVIGKLRARGVDLMRFNPGDYPVKASLSVSFDIDGVMAATLRTATDRIELQELDAIWFRRPEISRPDDSLQDSRLRHYVTTECASHLEDVWNALRCPCFPAAPMAIVRAGLKASQLALAGSLGFEIPSTLFTTSPADFLAFSRRHDGRIISKVAGTAFNQHFGPMIGRFTEAVSTRDLSYAQSVRFAPSIFQSSVDKRIELRITVVGERVFAAEIHSQSARRTRQDWRRYDIKHTLHRPHRLPSEVERRCVQLVHRLGLDYGAIDLVLTPDGRYVFLEINPNGQFLWIEQLTDLPISDAIADRLADAVRRQVLQRPLAAGEFA